MSKQAEQSDGCGCLLLALLVFMILSSGVSVTCDGTRHELSCDCGHAEAGP